MSYDYYDDNLEKCSAKLLGEERALCDAIALWGVVLSKQNIDYFLAN